MYVLCKGIVLCMRRTTSCLYNHHLLLSYCTTIFIYVHSLTKTNIMMVCSQRHLQIISDRTEIHCYFQIHNIVITKSLFLLSQYVSPPIPHSIHSTVAVMMSMISKTMMISMPPPPPSLLVII